MLARRRRRYEPGFRHRRGAALTRHVLTGRRQRLGAGSGVGTAADRSALAGGVEPPRLLREVKADYTDEARRANIAGEVELEIVVRRDGTVGDVKIIRGLRGGLNERAVQAVRQWRFAPGRMKGVPVDVVVEVGVEFKLR